MRTKMGAGLQGPDKYHIEHIAVLDDYQSVAKTMADWQGLRNSDGSAPMSTFFSDAIVDPDSLVERLHGFDCIVLMRGRTRLPAKVLQALPHLKLILTTGRLEPAVDLSAASELGIQVCGTVTLGHPTAELVWGLILTRYREIPAAIADLKSGIWAPRLGRCLHGRTIGLIGLGRIGKQVATIARAFQMDVLAWSQNLTSEAATAAGAKWVEKDELLSRSDIVSIHVIGGERYRGLIGAQELALMKPDALLVNTSRALIVDEGQLIDALAAGRPGGAVLDVFTTEPLPPSHPFLTLDQVLATPHLGYSTEENFRYGYQQIVEGISNYLGGEVSRGLNQPVAKPSAHFGSNSGK